MSSETEMSASNLSPRLTGEPDAYNPLSEGGFMLDGGPMF